MRDEDKKKKKSSHGPFQENQKTMDSPGDKLVEQPSIVLHLCSYSGSSSSSRSSSCLECGLFSEKLEEFSSKIKDGYRSHQLHSSFCESCTLDTILLQILEVQKDNKRLGPYQIFKMLIDKAEVVKKIRKQKWKAVQHETDDCSDYPYTSNCPECQGMKERLLSLEEKRNEIERNLDGFRP